MNNQYDYKHLVLVTNAFDSGDDVLFFTARTTQTDIHKNLKVQQVAFDEVYSIESKDIRFYCFDPFFCTEALENTMLERAGRYDSALHGPLKE